MSIVDKYRKVDNFEQYAQGHRQFENQISDLNQKRDGLSGEHSRMQGELQGMKREDDPKAYDDLEKATGEKYQDFQYCDKELEQTRSDFDQFKQTNKEYANAYEQAEELPSLFAERGLGNSREQSELSEDFSPGDARQTNTPDPRDVHKPIAGIENTGTAEGAAHYEVRIEDTTKEAGQTLVNSGAEVEQEQQVSTNPIERARTAAAQQPPPAQGQERQASISQPRLDPATADRIQRINEQDKDPNAVEGMLDKYKERAKGIGQDLQEKGVEMEQEGPEYDDD